MRPSEPLWSAATGQQRNNEFVAAGLSQVQTVRRERISQGTGDVQLKAVPEQMQANPRIRHRVVAVRNSVHQGLEDGPLTELRALDPSRRLGRPHKHVPPDEVQRFRNLLVKRPTYVPGVGLIVGIGALTRIADGLDICVREPFSRFPRTQQDACNSEARGALLVIWVVRNDDDLVAIRKDARFVSIRQSAPVA